MSDYHIPVLLEESVEGLNITPNGIYVDATYGGGGHSAAILRKLNKGRLYAFDQDEDAAQNLPDDQKFFFIQGNFRYLKNYLSYHGVKAIDGLIADLGVSSHHFDTPQRGFSYRTEAVLDMRMNRRGKLTAEMVVNDYETDRLTRLFTDYGELPRARKLAAAIGRYRSVQRIQTTTQLVRCLESCIPGHADNQFLSRIFQAIRIEVNHELENLNHLLTGAGNMLKTGGRLVIISYHSLEDRLVKNFMRWGNSREQPASDVYGHSEVPFRLVGRKPLTATEAEIRANPRARSARLRIAEKK